MRRGERTEGDEGFKGDRLEGDKRRRVSRELCYRLAGSAAHHDESAVSGAANPFRPSRLSSTPSTLAENHQLELRAR